jgi:cyclic pyranopterin monophosphate synthase
MRRLTHLSDEGHARMVNVGDKEVTERMAVATARVRIGKLLAARLRSKTLPKGDVFGVARIAGIMAAKKTSELIPLCHPLPLERVEVDVTLVAGGILLRATVSTSARTGVEMEALTAVSVAALTLYDMCKSFDRGMVIERVQLEEKRGGKSGTFMRKKKVKSE